LFRKSKGRRRPLGGERLQVHEAKTKEQQPGKKGIFHGLMFAIQNPTRNQPICDKIGRRKSGNTEAKFLDRIIPIKGRD